MAASPQTTVDSISLNNQNIFIINTTNVTKLTATNYLMWSLQIHALLDGYDLAGYLDGSTLIPEATIMTDTTVITNSAYTVWKRQDRLIFSALLGAISIAIQPIVSRATKSSELWSTLANTYAKPSRGHIKQLKAQLKTWTKGAKSIDEYVQGFVSRSDQLAILGKPLDLEDQIETILDGLPAEYKTVVDQVESRDTPPTMTELHERLINHESKLLVSASTPLLPVTANVVYHRNATTHHITRPHSSSSRNAKPWSPSPPPSSQGQRSDYKPRPYLGKCQLCHTQGHSTHRCPQLQGNVRFTPSVPPSTFRPWQPRANMAVAPPCDSGN